MRALVARWLVQFGWAVDGLSALRAAVELELKREADMQREAFAAEQRDLAEAIASGKWRSLDTSGLADRREVECRDPNCVSCRQRRLAVN